MEFYTADNPPVFKGSKPGTGYEEVYVKRLQKDGSTKLVLKGKSNTYEKIQSTLDDVDIFKQIQRFGLDNHSSLKEIKARFLVEDGTETIDLSSSASFNDFHNSLKEAEETFKSFNPEVRAFYGNDVNRFKSSLLNKTLDEDLAKMHKMFNVPQPTQNTAVTQPTQNIAITQPTQNTSVTQSQVNNGVIAGKQSFTEVTNNG